MGIVANTRHSVYHLLKDEQISGNVLYSTSTSLSTTDGYTTSMIVGSATTFGYKEGMGENARFRSVSTFIQHTSTTLLLVDSGNHCLRSVSRLTNTTSTFVGKCETPFQWEGTNPLFNSPSAVIEDSMSPGNFFITERLGQRLKYMTVRGEIKNVTTVYRGIQRFSRMVQQTTSGNIYITYDNGIAFYDYLQRTMSILVGSSTQVGSSTLGFEDGMFSSTKFNRPLGIVFLDRDILLVSDSFNCRLRMLDLSTNTSSSICSGKRGYSDGNLTTCQLDDPRALMIKNDIVYIGMFRSIKKVTGW